MRPWMLEAPPLPISPDAEAAFWAALEGPAPLPAGWPRWQFLQWVAAQGFLLHGSPQSDLTLFEPRTPHDLSPDDFSKRVGVFASSDGLWAMMYALRDRSRVARMLNMALQVRGVDGWSSMRYFLSLAPREGTVTDGAALLTPGTVYVLPPEGFGPMPHYDWPGLGTVREPQWLHAGPVRPLRRVPVIPADFPLPVGTHDAARTDALAAADPWGFPWPGARE